MSSMSQRKNPDKRVSPKETTDEVLSVAAMIARLEKYWLSKALEESPDASTVITRNVFEVEDTKNANVKDVSNDSSYSSVRGKELLNNIWNYSFSESDSDEELLKNANVRDISNVKDVSNDSSSSSVRGKELLKNIWNYSFSESNSDEELLKNANVRDISIRSVSMSVTLRGKELLKDASVMITHGRKYGLVGPNGSGKSTLLEHLALRKIPVPKNIDILFVEQEVVGNEKNAVETVLSSNKELGKLRREVAYLEKTDGCQRKLSELYEKLKELNSDVAEANARKILKGLGFTKDMQVRPTKSFSSEWRMRISLAKALFKEPTLLLLDEPTKHLDLRAVYWLQDYLSSWNKTLVVASHDRDFLNAVCTDIIHLHNQNLDYYRGNFDSFENGFDQRRKELIKNSIVANKLARSKCKIKEEKEYRPKFHFPEPSKLDAPLLQLIDVKFIYPDKADFKLSNVNVRIDMGTRVAIVGPKGAGKSTLLNLLSRDLLPTWGEVIRSQKLRVRTYSQHFLDMLTMDEKPIDHLLRLHSDQEEFSTAQAVRKQLGKFGLKGHNHRLHLSELSDGQKARVLFTSISMSKPHILVLDEPTNHLDRESIDALAKALDDFTGGVVLVSHDSRLISRVCEDEEKSEIWIVEDGMVDLYPGTFKEYEEELQSEIKADQNDNDDDDDE